MSIETVKYPPKGNLQPGLTRLIFKLTGTGAAPTAAAAADTDNRMISGISRSAAGVYAITLSQYGRVFMGATLTPSPSANGLVLGAASFSSGVLTVKIFSVPTAAGNAAAADIANADTALLTVEFKDSGAQ